MKTAKKANRKIRWIQTEKEKESETVWDVSEQALRAVR